MKYRFGDKIRTVRERRSTTLREVAEKAGVSESLVSQIERNKVSPAIDTLLAIADALDIDLEYLFSDYKKERAIRIVRSGERQVISRPGVVYERFAPLDSLPSGGQGIEAYKLELEPGASTGNDEYGHEGSELGVIVEGRAELAVGTEKYLLEPGDSASCASDYPHKLRNAGDGPLRVFWVITPPKPQLPSRS
ncbi:MAG: XRE family transcriptional regulator [Spirochaetes bacterium]|nr:XRE family transcriptional regulator [Spirochaetota bacterium]